MFHSDASQFEARMFQASPLMNSDQSVRFCYLGANKLDGKEGKGLDKARVQGYGEGSGKGDEW